MNFKDHFSKQSSIYATSRPGYPDELFSFLAFQVKEKKLAWDCGTGNGQAAVSLAKHFDCVIATDASQAQLKNAFKHEKVIYRMAASENSELPDQSVDLVTAAAAVHWFDHPRFYAEVKRVLKPGGIIAVWTYSDVNMNDDKIDMLFTEFALGKLKTFWPKENQLVWDKYKDLPFPFEQVDYPPFFCELSWDMVQLCNYFSSWSATQNYIKTTGKDPVEELMPRLQELWGDVNTKRPIKMELAMRVGRCA